MSDPAAPSSAGDRDGDADVLVTGASGLLGSYLARELGPGATLVGLSRIPEGDSRFVGCDLTDGDAVAQLLDEHRPRLVIQAAALTNVDLCERDPQLAAAVNRDAAGTVARLTAERGGRTVHISTDSVFDGRTGGYVESDDLAPLNGYARSKLEGEVAVAESAADHLVLRVNFFGRSGRGTGLADWLLGELTAGRPVTGFADVVFSPLHVAELARLILSLARSESRGTLHLGAADAVSKLEFAQLVAREYGLDEELIRTGLLVDAKLDAPRPLDTSLDSSRAASLLQRVLPTVAEGIAQMRVMAR